MFWSGRSCQSEVGVSMIKIYCIYLWRSQIKMCVCVCAHAPKTRQVHYQYLLSLQRDNANAPQIIPKTRKGRNTTKHILWSWYDSDTRNQRKQPNLDQLFEWTQTQKQSTQYLIINFTTYSKWLCLVNKFTSSQGCETTHLQEQEYQGQQVYEPLNSWSKCL